MLKQRYLYRRNSLLFIFFIISPSFHLSALSLLPPSESFFKALMLQKQRSASPSEINGLLRQSSISAPEPIKTEARTALLKTLEKEGDVSSALVLGETFLKSGSLPEKIVPVLAGILYRHDRYEEVYRLLSRTGCFENSDLLRYRVLVWGRLKKKDWHKVFTGFLITFPGDRSGKGRFTRIQEEWIKNGLIQKLTSGERLLLSVKVLSERRNYHKAGERALSFLRMEKSLGKPSGLLTPAVLDELVKITARSSSTGDILDIFSALIARAEKGFYSRKITAHLLWGAGYLSEKRHAFHAAAGFYKRGLVYAGNVFYDKQLWYWFAAELRISSVKALGYVDFLTENWHDPGYFSDILSDFTTVLVRNSRWKDINTLVIKLQGKAGGDVLSRLSYLAARGADKGYFSADDAEILHWYAAAIREGRGVASGLYYKIMAQAALQKHKNPSSGKDFRIFISDDSSKPPAFRGYDQLLAGAMEYDLPEYGKEVIDEYSSRFSLPGIRLFTRFLQGKGDYLDSIRIMSRYAALNGYRVTGDDVKILYPQGYRDIISAVRKKEHLPVPVFTALIREESHFSSTIVSSAGAVGLSQLMPSTAEDISRRMGLGKADITRPDVNAALGGWYLGNLLGRTDTVLDALFAYNGGLTRVRRWKKTYGMLPEDLFLEVLPYKETSLYGRKVLVSAVVYGYLYFGLAPGKVIHLFMDKRF